MKLFSGWKMLVICLVLWTNDSRAQEFLKRRLKSGMEQVQTLGRAPVKACDGEGPEEAEAFGAKTCRQLNAPDTIGPLGICQEALSWYGLKDYSVLDSCLSVEENRYDENYQSANRRQLRKAAKGKGWRLASYKELEAYVKELQEKSLAYKLACCGKDQYCLDLMKNIKIYYCDNPEARKNPKLPDYCSDLAFFSLGGEKEVETYLEKLSSPRPSSSREVDWLGYIVVSPYYQKGKGGEKRWMDGDLTLAHEFGHACRSVKHYQLATAEGVSEKESKVLMDMAKRYQGSKEEYCQYDEGAQEFYKYLSREMGDYFNDDLYKCMQEPLSKAQKECTPFCASQMIDETYADLVKLTVYPDWAMDNQCLKMRDSEHPMGVDVVTCLAKTSPSFNRQLKELIKCAP